MKKLVLLVLGLTIIETAGFFVWTDLALTSFLQGILGLVIFGVFLTGEHSVQKHALTGGLRGFPKILGFSFLESFVVWGVGLFLWQAFPADSWYLGALVAYAYWTLFLIIEHTITDNVLFDWPIFRRLFNSRNFSVSALEAVAGVAGIALWPISPVGAIAAWFAGNGIEHYVLTRRAEQEIKTLDALKQIRTAHESTRKTISPRH